MKRPVFVRALTPNEHDCLVAGLRSPEAFVLRRCQILLASARGKIARQIATDLGCDDQTVRNAIAAFKIRGLACLAVPSARPHTIHAAFDAARAEQLQALLHQSPRAFGKPTSVWTLDLAAEVSFERGVSSERVTGETVRARLSPASTCAGSGRRNGSPAPTRRMSEKKGARSSDPSLVVSPGLGIGLRGRDLVEQDGPAGHARVGAEGPTVAADRAIGPQG